MVCLLGVPLGAQPHDRVHRVARQDYLDKETVMPDVQLRGVTESLLKLVNLVSDHNAWLQEHSSVTNAHSDQIRTLQAKVYALIQENEILAERVYDLDERLRELENR